MPTNWPPSGIPSWPPPELGTTWFSCSDLRTLIRTLQSLGFTQRAPTSTENNSYFQNARCDHGDKVIGRMIISPGGTAYPVAVCNDANHRALLACWYPYDIGALSGVE